MAAVAATAAVVGIGVAVNRVISNIDDIAKAARGVGIAADEFQALQLAIERSGGDARTTSTGIRTLTRAISEANQGLVSYQRVFDRYGISLRNADGSQRATLSTLTELVNKMREGRDDAQEFADLQVLVGSRAASAFNVFVQGEEDVSQLLERMRELGIVLQDDTLRNAEEARDSLDFLGLAIRNTSYNLIGDFLPAITKLSNAMTSEFVPALNNAIEAQDGFLKGFKNLTQEEADQYMRDLAESLVSIANSLGKIESLDFSWVDRLGDLAVVLGVGYAGARGAAAAAGAAGAVGGIAAAAGRLAARTGVLNPGNLDTAARFGNTAAHAFTRAAVPAGALIGSTLLDYLQHGWRGYGVGNVLGGLATTGDSILSFLFGENWDSGLNQAGEALGSAVYRYLVKPITDGRPRGEAIPAFVGPPEAYFGPEGFVGPLEKTEQALKEVEQAGKAAGKAVASVLSPGLESSLFPNPGYQSRAGAMLEELNDDLRSFDTYLTRLQRKADEAQEDRDMFSRIADGADNASQALDRFLVKSSSLETRGAGSSIDFSGFTGYGAYDSSREGIVNPLPGTGTRDFLANLDRVREETTKTAEDVEQRLSSIGATLVSSFSSAFQLLETNTRHSFDNWVNSLLNSLARLYADRLFTNLFLGQGFSFADPYAGGGAASVTINAVDAASVQNLLLNNRQAVRGVVDLANREAGG